jgi:hypothetical protein
LDSLAPHLWLVCIDGVSGFGNGRSHYPPHGVAAGVECGGGVKGVMVYWYICLLTHTPIDHYTDKP